MTDFYTSIILTIFNKEKIIEKVIDSLFMHSSSLIQEYIFVLDGCTDSSEKILKSKIAFIPYGAKYKIMYANNVFELRANNIGLKEVSLQYAIIIQDDMVIMEPNWNERLILPMQKYNDIWAVTARTSCSLNNKGEWYNIKEGPVGHKYIENSDYPRNIIYVGQVINRGPLLVKMSVIKEIGYFDETLPGCIGCDDVDACLKIFSKFGLRCCSFYVKYISPLEWGSTRVGPNASYCSKQEILNRNEIINRYRYIIDNWKYDEIRYV